MSRSVDQEPDQSNGFYNSHRYADSSSVPVMKKTKAVSPRLTRSRAAKSAAATAIEEIAPVKNSRSKSSAVDTKRVRAGSKSKFNQMEVNFPFHL